MNVLVDSDILIEVLRGRDDGILKRWAELADSQDTIWCSPVSVTEIWHGVRPLERPGVARLLDALVCPPVDRETGRQAGEFLREFHRSHAVELADALIAASALQQRARLWTRNRKHYPMRALTFY